MREQALCPTSLVPLQPEVTRSGGRCPGVRHASGRGGGILTEARKVTARSRALRAAGADSALIADTVRSRETSGPKATLSQVADHIEHIRDVAGVDHVGLGSDFDGITTVPVGLEDVSKFPDLLAELLRRGWSEQDVRKVAGLNVLRVLRDAERVSREMSAARD